MRTARQPTRRIVRAQPMPAIDIGGEGRLVYKTDYKTAHVVAKLRGRRRERRPRVVVVFDADAKRVALAPHRRSRV